MAERTWTLLRNDGTLATVLSFGGAVVDHNNRFVYMFAHNGTSSQVYRWNGFGSSAVTNISGAPLGTAGWLIRGAVWFKKGLYILIEDTSVGTEESFVYKWDGPGTTTWTQKLQLTSGFDANTHISCESWYIAADNFQIVACGDDLDNGKGVVEGSTDGESWTHHTFNGDTTYELEPQKCYGMEKYSGYGRVLVQVNDPVASPSLRMMEFAGSNNWTPLGAANVAHEFVGFVDGYQIYLSDTTGDLSRSTDWGVTLAADNSGLGTGDTFGFVENVVPQQAVFLPVTNGNQVYAFDIINFAKDGTIGGGDSVVTFFLLKPELTVAPFTVWSPTLYAWGDPGIAEFNLYGTPGGGKLASFYYGTDTLTTPGDQTANIRTILGVNPRGMAVDPAGFTVVGSNNKFNTGSVVMYSQLPYASWLDLTPGYGSGTAVVSVRYV